MKTIKIISAILICESAGFIGSFFTIKAIPTWYQTLTKPSFNPPSWLFGPVWTLLYALMGFSAYRIWTKGIARRDVRLALLVFFIQLVLNAFWSIIFFGWRNPGLALIEIIVMWLMIALTMVAFAKIDKLSAWLMLPYFLWVSFASVLNFAIWRLN